MAKQHFTDLPYTNLYILFLGEHRIWAQMKQRCHNPKSYDWKNYGGRGISVCQRWRVRFRNFLLDVGPRPSPQHTLDRINNELGYFPENVRWATRKEQARNTRVNTILTHNGKSLTVAEWAEKTGLDPSRIVDRLLNWGWSVERALTTPAGQGNKTRRAEMFTHNGVTQSIANWCREFGICYETVHRRIHIYDWPVAKAVLTPSRGWHRRKH